MFDWLTHRGLTTRTASSPIAPRVVRGSHPTAGEYNLLYQYLHNRYANRVVLTFAEIEDLLGFPLPDLARIQFEWWDDGDLAVGPSTQSLAWTLAERTATVNLEAQSVVFERDEDS